MNFNNCVLCGSKILHDNHLLGSRCENENCHFYYIIENDGKIRSFEVKPINFNFVFYYFIYDNDMYLGLKYGQESILLSSTIKNTYEEIIEESLNAIVFN